MFKSSAICPCLMRLEELEPDEKSANRVCTSRALTSFPLSRYDEPISLVIFLDISISLCRLNSLAAFCSELSISKVTSAKFLGLLPSTPAKITSSIPDALIEDGLLSPINHWNASIIFDFPQPLGPTIPVSPGNISTSVESTKLLKPRSRSFVISKKTLPFYLKKLIINLITFSYK